MNITAELNPAFKSCGLGENTVPLQSRPGILVFSRSRQLQYVNRRALELIENAGLAQTPVCSISFPSRLFKLRDEIRARLDDRLKASLWDPFEESRVVIECGRKLLLRGFGYPDRGASRGSRIVILLEPFAEKDTSHQVPASMKAPERQTAGIGYAATL